MTFLDRLGVVGDSQSESKVSLLISPSPELLTVKVKTPPGNPQYVYQMKGHIELSNFVVETVSSKCITSSKTEGENEVKVKMYRKCMEICFQMCFSV